MSLKKKLVLIVSIFLLVGFSYGCSEEPLIGDYTQLENLLSQQKWQEGNYETRKVVFQVFNRIGGQIINENLLDAETVVKFPCKELKNIDRLWVKHSKDRFGFSVQNKIWYQMGGSYDMQKTDHLNIWFDFRKRVGWQGGVWNTSDSQKSTNWYISKYAPDGYLPSDIQSSFRLDHELGGFRFLARAKECGL